MSGSVLGVDSFSPGPCAMLLSRDAERLQVLQEQKILGPEDPVTVVVTGINSAISSISKALLLVFEKWETDVVLR